MDKLIIKIMADYECFPLWLISDKKFENISPENLPLTPSLKDRISEWQRQFDLTLNRTDPAQSGFKNAQEEQEFEDEGLAIWQFLQRELIKLYEIKYFSAKDGILHSNSKIE